jgi:hypothetical protein
VNTKREGLEYLQQHSNWLNGRVPTIMTAAEAYLAQAPGRRFYTVAWWGDDDKQLPAGFTHFEFEQVAQSAGNAYVIFWRDEPRDRVGTLPAGELVLMFSD